MSLTGNFTFQKFNFPCGEPHVRLTDAKGTDIDIDFEWEKKPEEILDLVLLVSAIKSAGLKLGSLSMPYIPFSRQDRVATPGDAFSLKAFAQLINSLGFKDVYVVDPHSDVATALFDNVYVTSQAEVFHEVVSDYADGLWLVSPDAGASKKIGQLAKVLPRGKVAEIMECSKVRDPQTGALSKFSVPMAPEHSLQFVIVDDICDGGGTFIEIARRLRDDSKASHITLCVTHGFFTKGIEVFDGLIDEIYTRKGKVK